MRLLGVGRGAIACAVGAGAVGAVAGWEWVKQREARRGPWVKLLRQDEKHNGLQFQTGKTVDPLPWNTKPGKGGIYFCRPDDLLQWLDLYTDAAWVRTVEVPLDARIHIEKRGKAKAEAVVLGERVPLHEWMAERWGWAATIARCPDALAYAPQTPELCWAAVRADGMAIRFVTFRTPELEHAAVARNPYAIKYVTQSETLQLLAVRGSADAFYDIVAPTPAVCALRLQWLAQ